MEGTRKNDAFLRQMMMIVTTIFRFRPVTSQLAYHVGCIQNEYT